MALQITVPSVMIAVRFLTAFAVLNLIALIGPRIRVPAKASDEGALTETASAETHAGQKDEGALAETASAETHAGQTPATRPLVEFSLRGKPLRYILLLALFQPILYFLCESYGIVYTSASFAGTIIAVMPVAGIVFDVVIMHSSVRPRQIVCAILSAVGVAITTIGAEGMRSSVLGLLILL